MTKQGQLKDIESTIEGLSKDRKDWIGVFGNQWKPVKVMPGTCMACVWGRGEHATGCARRAEWVDHPNVTEVKRLCNEAARAISVKLQGQLMEYSR